MALNDVCGKTSSDDTFKYIIGGKESYLLVTNSSPSIHFQLCTTYILKTLPWSPGKSFTSCFVDILWHKECWLGMSAKITATKINADKVSKVDFPQHFLTGQYIPVYDQGHTYWCNKWSFEHLLRVQQSAQLHQFHLHNTWQAESDTSTLSSQPSILNTERVMPPYSLKCVRLNNLFQNLVSYAAHLHAILKLLVPQWRTCSTVTI